MKILVVDDDPGLRNVVRLALERAGYSVVMAATGLEAVTHAMREDPALIVLDIGLPEMDGLDVCLRIRQRSEVPILFLTARDDEVDRILGLELGADDYVTKPFSPRELVARIRTILKRTTAAQPLPAIRYGEILLEEATHTCRVSGTEVTLTGREFSILMALMRQPDRVHARANLVDAIWGNGSQVSDRTFDSHLRNLRQKLSDAGCVDAIETVHGIGLRLKALVA
ncbi:MAG: response regulator transcription factor [Pseudomonadota bacterium]